MGSPPDIRSMEETRPALAWALHAPLDGSTRESTQTRFVTAADERGYILVHGYECNGQTLMLDCETGIVHFTGILKALGQKKADVVKLIEGSPELANLVIKIRGGFLKIQGTWLPYDIAEILARRIAYSIREDLVPIFGPNFPSTCLRPDEPGFGKLVLSNEPESPTQSLVLAYPAPSSKPRSPTRGQRTPTSIEKPVSPRSHRPARSNSISSVAIRSTSSKPYALPTTRNRSYQPPSIQIRTPTSFRFPLSTSSAHITPHCLTPKRSDFTLSSSGALSGEEDFRSMDIPVTTGGLEPSMQTATSNALRMIRLQSAASRGTVNDAAGRLADMTRGDSWPYSDERRSSAGTEGEELRYHGHREHAWEDSLGGMGVTADLRAFGRHAVPSPFEYYQHVEGPSSHLAAPSDDTPRRPSLPSIASLGTNARRNSVSPPRRLLILPEPEYPTLPSSSRPYRSDPIYFVGGGSGHTSPTGLLMDGSFPHERRSEYSRSDMSTRLLPTAKDRNATNGMRNGVPVFD